MKVRKVFYGFVLVILVAGVFGFTNCGNAESPADQVQQKSVEPSSSSSNAASSFTLVDLNGNQVSLDQYKGKVVMLNFWATWCPPCRRELPDIVRLREELKDNNFEVIGIIAEQPNDNVINNVNALKSQFGMNYPLVWFSNQVINDYGPINGIPRTFILNKKGEIVGDFEGARPYEVFKQAVSPWL